MIGLVAESLLPFLGGEIAADQLAGNRYPLVELKSESINSAVTSGNHDGAVVRRDDCDGRGLIPAHLQTGDHCSVSSVPQAYAAVERGSDECPAVGGKGHTVDILMMSRLGCHYPRLRIEVEQADLARRSAERQPATVR